MSVVNSSKDFQSNDNSIFSQPKRYRSESLPPPRIVTNGQFDPITQQLHVEDVVPLKNETKDSQPSASSRRSNKDRNTRYASQSFSLMRTIDEKEQNDQQNQDNRLLHTNVTHVKRFPLPDVVRFNENPTHSLSQLIRSESSSQSIAPIEQVDIPLENRHADNSSSSNIHSENVYTLQRSSGSFCSLKNVDEKEYKDQLTKTIQPKQNSTNRRKQSVSFFGTGPNSSMANFYNGDLTLLDPNLHENRRLISNSHISNLYSTKYNFHSSDSVTTIHGKPEENNRRIIILFNWQNTYYYKALGVLFAMAACSIAIAALIFALISYRSTLPESTITTTSSTSSTSTSSTSTTSTSTTTHTTTSTTTDSTTSTSGTTTSTTSTTSTAMCSTTTMTTRVTATPLPSQCTTYMNINDPTRLASHSGSVQTCDQSIFPSATWVRFTGGSGVSLANCPVTLHHCGANATGWYSGVYPAVAGELTEGAVCYNWANKTCNWQTNIQITNCNGYYVYELGPPPVCNARYCTI